MKDFKINRETLSEILTDYFHNTALSDDDAKIIIDYHDFDDGTLIELAFGVVGLVYGTSGRKVADILDGFQQMDDTELKIKETALKIKELENRIKNEPKNNNIL